MTDEDPKVTEHAPEGAEPDATPDEAPENEPTSLPPEALAKELEKVRKEAAKYRTRNKTLEQQFEESKKAAERAKMDEVEAAKAEAEDLRKELEAARTEAQKATWKASLTGKVANTDAALKLLDPDKHVGEDGAIDVDAFLSEYDFLAPQQGRSPVTPANTAAPKQGPLTAKDFRGKSRDWIRENLHRLKSN